MSWRVVIVSSRSKLELKLGYLVVRGVDETKRVLLDDISVLLIENTGCVVSAALMEAMWERKIVIILCDCRHNPGAQIIPLQSNYESSARLYVQTRWEERVKEAVWVEIIRDKITKQALMLQRHAADDSACGRLLEYASEIEPFDVTNREGHAAKVYFNALMGASFSRIVPSFWNSALDYGYSIILAAVNRSVVAHGYSTQLGISHHNTFNPFNLSSDIMESFRPLIDEKVLALPIEEELSPDAKHRIVSILNDKVMIRGRSETVLNAIDIYVCGILDALDSSDVSKIVKWEYEA